MKIAFAVLVFVPGLAIACGPGEKPVFSCTTTKQRQVEVCQAPTTVNYTFGKRGAKPEMSIKEPNASMRWIDGSGRMETHEALTFHSGATRYRIAFDVYKYEGESVDATLEVLQGNKSVTTIQCKDKSIRYNSENLKANRQNYGDDGTQEM